MIALTRDQVAQAVRNGLTCPPDFRGRVLQWTRVIAVDESTVVVAVPHHTLQAEMKRFAPRIERILLRHLIVLVGEETDFKWLKD